MIERHFQESERVQILHLGLGAELFRAAQPDAYIGVAAQVTLFHIAGGDLDVLQHLLQLGQKRVGFVRIPHIGIADNLDQRRAGPVQVDVSEAVGILESVMNALAGVVFHVDARDADALLRPVDLDIDVAMLGERLIVLRDLIALGKVRIKIVLAGEYGSRVHLTVQRERGFDGQFHGLPAQHR